MKPSALKRKRCAQLFAINRAQIHPRNAENSYSQPQGVKLDTHVAGPLLHVMLSNPLFGNQVYGLPPVLSVTEARFLKWCEALFFFFETDAALRALFRILTSWWALDV